MAGVLGVGVPILNACQITRVDVGALSASGIPNLHVPDGCTARRLAIPAA